jgi:hypothetical protein
MAVSSLNPASRTFRLQGAEDKKFVGYAVIPLPQRIAPKSDVKGWNPQHFESGNDA